MAKTITIEIDLNGKVSIDAEGFTGSACQELTKELEERIGQVDDVNLKPEHFDLLDPEQISIGDDY